MDGVMKLSLPIQYVMECVSYNPDTGIISWLTRPEGHFKNEASAAGWNKQFAGKPAGCINGHGYIQFAIGGVRYRAHRVAWAIISGSWPSGDVDHINGIRHDNRICNLRNVSTAENARNQKLHVRNSSGISGVSLNKASGLWYSHISTDSGRIYLGRFKNIEDAALSRKSAEKMFGYHENHGRRQ